MQSLRGAWVAADGQVVFSLSRCQVRSVPKWLPLSNALPNHRLSMLANLDRAAHCGLVTWRPAASKLLPGDAMTSARASWSRQGIESALPDNSPGIRNQHGFAGTHANPAIKAVDSMAPVAIGAAPDQAGGEQSCIRGCFQA